MTNILNLPTTGGTVGDTHVTVDGTVYVLSEILSNGRYVWNVQTDITGAAHEIGFLAPGHDDHSGGENNGEIILGDSQNNIISALPVDVRALSAVVEDDNGLIGTDNARLVFNVSTQVQAGDERPVNSAAVQTALDNLPAGHSNIGGILSITSTPDKVAEIGIYDTSSARIGQQFVISTVNTVNDVADITINSEPASGSSTENLAQRLELLLNKATTITDGDNRVPTTQAVLDYVTSIETNPVTTANVRAVLQDDTGNRGVSFSIDSGTNKIVAVAGEDTTKQDQITGNSGQISIPGAGPEGAALTFTGGGSPTATTVEALFNDSTDSRGVSYAVADGKINTTVAADSTKADTSTTVIDTDVILNGDNQITGISIAGTTRNIVPGGSDIPVSNPTATGQNIIGITVDSDGNLTGVTRGTVSTAGDVSYDDATGVVTIGSTSFHINDVTEYPTDDEGVASITVKAHSIWHYGGDVWLRTAVTDTTITDGNYLASQPEMYDTQWERLGAPPIRTWPDSFPSNFFLERGMLWQRRRKNWEYLGATVQVTSSNFSSLAPNEGLIDWHIESHDAGSCNGILGSNGFYSRFGITSGRSVTTEPSDRDEAIAAYEAMTSAELAQGDFDDHDRIQDIGNNVSIIMVRESGQWHAEILPFRSEVATLIATETTNREAADTTLQNNIDAEAVTRAEADALEAFTREAGDDAERDYVNTTLHVDAADSQSYYQFSGQPAIFTEDAGVDYGITIAMPETIEDTESLVQAENIGETTKVFKLTLRYGDGANDTKQYIVTTGGYNFTISDERSSETFRLPTIEGTYSAASVHINGTSTRRQDCFLAIGGWFGRIAQVDMAHVLNVSNGDILAGRTLEEGQDYSSHTIADNNGTAVVGLVFDNQTTGSHTGINAYTLQRRNRIVRYRASASGGLFSFRHGDSVVDRFHPSRVPDVVSQQTVEESNWLGLKLVTIQNAISNTSASGQSNRLTFAVGDKMLVAVGEAVDSASAGISIPGIAISKNPSTFAGGNVNLGLFYPGGNDPSEEYSNYSSATEANFDATIFDMEYSNASGAWTFFFGGESNQATTIETRAAGFHGTSIWNLATVSAATKVGAGGIIRSVALGGNIAGLASDTNYWLTTELGALYITKTPWLGAGYSDSTLIQAHVNPNDPTSDIKRDFTFRGFQYFDQHGSIGAADDGHIYRLVINPEITFTVTYGNVTHTATYRFNDDTAAMHTFFGTPSNWTPTLVNTGINLTTLAPGSEPADQLYLDFSVNGQNTPVVSYQWVGVLATTDDDFETYNPFRRLLLENTAVDIHYPDGGATYHAVLSSNANDYTAGNETNEAVDQIVAVVNEHTAQGHSAVRVDGQFADTITNTRPVLRLDQAGTHALQNAPTITVVHPEEQVSGTLAVVRFADGGYDTIGRPGGLFDPNDYDTRAELDAKIAAIASTHGYAENIVANAGSGDTTYTRLDRLQVGTEIYSTSTRLGELNDTGQFVTLEELTNQTVTFVAGGNITLSGGEITITANSTYRIVATWGDDYTGTITFPAAAASNVGGALVIDTTTLGIVYSPPFPSTGFSVTGNSDIQEELGVPTYVGVSGDVRLEGTGVSRNGQVFTFSDTSKQDNLTVTVGSSGAVWTPNTSTLDLSSITSGDSTTAAQVEGFFADSTASRGVSYSESGGVITTTVAADTSKQDVIDSNNRLPTVNIGTGDINNAELNTLNGINTNETIQEQLDAKAGTAPEIYQNTPSGSAATGLFLTTSNSSGTRLRFTSLPDTGTGGSALKGILTSAFEATSIVGGGNATWTESAGLQFTSTTTPTPNKRYIFRFDVVGAVLFEFNSNDVQFVNSQWQIHRADVAITGNVNFGDSLAYNPSGTMFADIYSDDLSLGSNLTLVNGVLDSTGGGSVSDPFKYALLLTNGFLLPENTAMSTSARDAYTDTAGAYGTAGNVYWFDNTNDSWYSVATGGTALVSFPS